MLSNTVGMAKSTAEHGATSEARAALSHSSARVLASQACSVAEPSIAQTTASLANWLAADTTGTPVQDAARHCCSLQWAVSANSDMCVGSILHGHDLLWTEL